MKTEFMGETTDFMGTSYACHLAARAAESMGIETGKQRTGLAINLFRKLIRAKRINRRVSRSQKRRLF